MVTSAPNDFQTLANSQPMTPPPSTTTDVGTRSSLSAWSLVITWLPSMSSPGRLFAYDPVARTTCLPSYRWPSTSTAVGLTSRPIPSMKVIFRLLTRPCRPL
jgi:hypothetical protein